MNFNESIEKRRTFGIISHPDAGKTTLTEKLLLFGGAIQSAGAVKNNKIKKTATSDFMEIEKQRGISVATSVMAFGYKNKQINILDTPGHKDFAEDTFRTLTAVDSVILVIDVASGVESQTEKLMEVCRMRKTPVIIFINKMDRDGKESFDLLDELEHSLSIKVRPLTWPIGMGDRFQGVYNIYQKGLNLFSANKTKIAEDVYAVEDINDKELDEIIGEEPADGLFDLKSLGSSFEGSNSLMYLINGSVKGIDGYIKRLIDEIRGTLKKNDLKASRTKIALSWTLDQHAMRGDKIEMLQNLTSKLRDYIGDVEAYEDPDFNLFHSDKTTIIVACSQSDFKNIENTKKDSNLIIVKANPLCETIQ